MSKEKNVKMKPESFWERNRKSEGYLLQKRAGEIMYKILRAILIFGLVFLILQPLLNKISCSFMAERDLYDPTVISIPRNFTLNNYKLTMQLMKYWRVLFNSMWISLLVSVLQVAACTLVGYGFARFKFPLKNVLFACVILVIVVPPQTISSSLYLHFRYFNLGFTKVNLLNTILPYLMLVTTCMGLKSGLYIYLIRQFFRGIPKELEEAAYVDGCGKLRTFLRIMLPDAKPIITSCFLFAFVWQWTDSYYTKLFLGNVTVLSKALTGLEGRLSKYWEAVYSTSNATVAYTQCIISTGILLAIIPLLILYLFAQKGFVESLSQSGIKM